MKSRFLIIGAFLAFVIYMIGGYTDYQSQRKEVTWQELQVLTEVSSKRDYCSAIGLISNDNSELFYSTVNRVYALDRPESNGRKIIIEKNMNGKIYVENTHEGANFIIKLSMKDEGK